MVPSLFEALFALLMKEGSAVTEAQVRLVMADPSQMVDQVVLVRQEIEADYQQMQRDRPAEACTDT